MSSAASTNSLARIVARSLKKDKSLFASLAISLSATAAFAALQIRSKEVQEQIQQHSHGHASSKPKTVQDAQKPSQGKGNVRPNESTKEESARAAALAGTTDNKVAKSSKGAGGAAVDAKFLQRLMFVLRIVIPSWTSKETLLLLTQVCVLVSRSLLSLRVARLGGDGLQAVLERSWRDFGLVLADFFLSGVGAAVVNSALKYLTNSITVAFRQRLTLYTHEKYLQNNSYYKAAVLRVGNLDNADQRIVEDLHQFCATAADLFARTFKPALDVVLATTRMSENMGWKGLSILYTYFVFSGGLVRAISPPFSKFIAEMQKREGDFRSCHSRLITNAEEVAFLHGSMREKAILNKRLGEVTAFSTYYFLLQFKQGCIDQYVLKYFASMIGWPIIAVPFLMKTDMEVSEVAARYRESDTLIQAASSSIGDLLMVYKKLQRLAGFTTRVVELLEAVDTSNQKDDPVYTDDTIDDVDAITFENITIHAPDQRLLVKNMNLTLQKGENLLITGANGAGKTSLFRCLAGLWQPTEGQIVRPSGGSVQGKVALFYVPQRPYLVTGTLRDQITYPQQESGAEVDARIMDCLRMVNLMKVVESSPEGLDLAPHDWTATLSGGEKQRVGFARLYYHRPAFAVLDEATSAINPDEEGKLYQQVVELGITVFSIAHRMELKKFHHKHLHYAADGEGTWQYEALPVPDKQPS